MTTKLPEHQYQRKVKTREELREIIGAPPRAKSVIMCHGAFDLVHPGHVRHLTYAKSKADILVASLTSDAHISKAHYRPFVPQQLRSMNLAALEVVDYVIVDENETPLENIEFLKPDFFAKGYEYFDGGVHPKTEKEIAALSSYGGEVIFTPGDVVFSSSAFIELAPPKIAADKLTALMNSEEVTLATLREGVESLKGISVHVLGDTILDSYVYGSPIGSSATKTPTLSIKYERQVDFAGGAAIVARHLREAGAEVLFSTVMGDDDHKEFVLQEMKTHGVRCEAEIDKTRVTTQKSAYIAGGYRLLKVDRVDNRPISERILEKFKNSLGSSGADAVVFSDFRHGIFSPATIAQLSAAVPDKAFKVGDSQVASRWGNILDFNGFDLITPNEREARFALGDQDSVIRPLALELYKRAKCRTLILKLGARGILTYRAPNPDVRSFFTVDSFTEKVVDPIGAGDALLAYATLALVATGSQVIASILGSMAAAIACEHEGNQPVSPAQVLDKLDVLKKQLDYV